MGWGGISWKRTCGSADEQESGKFHSWLDDYAAKLAAGESPATRIAK